MKSRSALVWVMCAGVVWGAVTIPEGTRVRVRLDESISSATAEKGQTVVFSTTDPVMVGNEVVIPEGAMVTGTITEAQPKRHMGRAGKLDFSIDRVKAADNEWVPLRYTLNRESGDSHAVRTGVITAGVAAVFWPAAPVFLLMKGKDVTVNKDVVFDVFTDKNYVVAAAAAAAAAPAASAAAAPAAPAAAAGGTATVSITSSVAGADIEVDGNFSGNTPTTLQLAGGAHDVVIRSGARSWERRLHVTAGSTISLSAALQ
jgi:hypothetical protein